MRSSRGRAAGLAGILILMVAAPSEGQERTWTDRAMQAATERAAAAPDGRLALPSPLRVAPSEPAPADDSVGTGALVVSAVLATAIGTAGGAWAGYWIDRGIGLSGGDDPGLLGTILGWYLGPVITTPYAVNFTNGGRGSQASGRRATLLVGGVGLVLTFAMPVPVAIIGTPVAQAATAVLVERRTAR